MRLLPVLIALFLAALTACGQTGPLTRPDKPVASPTPAVTPPVSTPP